jgi:hypothetical protein
MAIQILDMIPEDIKVKLLISLKDIEKLEIALSTARLNHSTPEQLKAVKYVTEEFYPFIKSLVTEAKK